MSETRKTKAEAISAIAAASDADLDRLAAKAEAAAGVSEAVTAEKARRHPEPPAAASPPLDPLQAAEAALVALRAAITAANAAQAAAIAKAVRTEERHAHRSIPAKERDERLAAIISAEVATCEALVAKGRAVAERVEVAEILRRARARDEAVRKRELDRSGRTWSQMRGDK